MKNIVIYHDNCLDGTCAAWVASRYLKEKDTTYIPVRYGKPLGDQMILPLTVDYKHDVTLYILDWCPEMKDLDECCKGFNRVILIDHHESAIKKLKEHYLVPNWHEAAGTDTRPKNLEVFLAHNNEWSGAMGTAIWFGTKMEANKKASQRQYVDHWLVKAVDDRDRWQFKYPDTKAINANLFLIGFDLAKWQIMPWTDAQKNACTLIGEHLLQKQEREVQQIIESSAIIDDNAERIVFCNCPYHLASEVGNILAKDYRMAVLWYMDKEGQISVSLRSNKDTPDWINCATLAQALGGGGHAPAAGFKMDCSFEEMVCALDDAVIDTEQSIVPF